MPLIINPPVGFPYPATPLLYPDLSPLLSIHLYNRDIASTLRTYHIVEVLSLDIWNHHMPPHSEIEYMNSK